MIFFLVNFLSDLVRAGGWVFLLGGFVCVFNMLYDWLNDQWLDYKIGGWFSKQEYVFLRVFPPAINESSMGEMEQFFQRIWCIYQKRTPFEIYTEGKWYQGYIIEFHSKGGHIGIFIRVNKMYVSLVKSSLEASFLGIHVVECPNPFEGWPQDWDRKTGRYTQMYGALMTIMTARDPVQKRGKDCDVYQIKTWKDFQRDFNKPMSDPAAGLFSILKNLDPEEYLVIQFCIQPFFDEGRIKKWKQMFQEKKLELTQNADTSVNEEGEVSMLTDSEKSILNGMDKKIHSLNFLTKIRFVAFSNEKTAQKRATQLAFSYFVQFNSHAVVFYPDPDTVTSKEPKGDIFGILGPQMGLFLDKAFYEKERYFREKCLYQGLLRRSLGVGTPPFYLTPEELAAMIHFPYVTLEDSKMQTIIENTKPENQQGSGPAYKNSVPPPPNLPT